MSIAATVAGVLNANGVSHLTDYAMNTMRIESGGRAEVRNSRSSATGLFQFVRDTWEEVMPDVPFSQATDPRQNTLAFIRLTERNERYLEGRLGREPQDWEVYLAHFSGAGRAAQLLESLPSARLDSIFSARAMAANPHLAELGNVGEYLTWVQAKYNDTPYRAGQYRNARSGVSEEEDRFGDDELGRRMTRESLRHDNREEEALGPMMQILSLFMGGLFSMIQAIFSPADANESDLGNIPSQVAGQVTEQQERTREA